MKKSGTSALVACVLAMSMQSMPIQAAEKTKIVERQTVQLRNGVLVLREQEGGQNEGDKDLALKIDGKIKKIIKLGPFECGSLHGPYRIGESDVISIDQPSCGCGNGCGDASTITLMTVDKAGNIVPQDLNSGAAAKEASFNCDGLEDEATTVSTTAIKFKCISRDGRKTKSTFFTFENGRIKSSRQ